MAGSRWPRRIRLAHVLGNENKAISRLLLVARKPPTDRRVLVNGVDVVVDHGGERLALTSQTYVPFVEGDAPIVSHQGRPVDFTFDNSRWPTWTYDLGDGQSIEHCVVVPRLRPAVPERPGRIVPRRGRIAPQGRIDRLLSLLSGTCPR